MSIQPIQNAGVGQMEQANILWRRVDTQGHDACRLRQFETGWSLNGATAFVEDGETGAFQYEVQHDADWQTRSATIAGWVGSQEVHIQIACRPAGSWLMNASPVGDVAGATDIDLGLTPATNTTAIRRLRLGEGERAASTAAWLDPTDWRLKPLEQTYFRRSGTVYEYASPTHGFSAVLTVDDFGLLTDYPGIWLKA